MLAGQAALIALAILRDVQAVALLQLGNLRGGSGDKDSRLSATCSRCAGAGGGGVSSGSGAAVGNVQAVALLPLGNLRVMGTGTHGE